MVLMIVMMMMVRRWWDDDNSEMVGDEDATQDTDRGFLCFDNELVVIVIDRLKLWLGEPPAANAIWGEY